MVTLHNKRGGIIRLASDVPVYFGTPTQITERDADRILSTPLAKAYLKSGSLKVDRPARKSTDKSAVNTDSKGKGEK